MSGNSFASGNVALAERPAAFEEFEDDFTLDVRVIVASHPIAKLECNTDDNCGNTCTNGASACDSSSEDPSWRSSRY